MSWERDTLMRNEGSNRMGLLYDTINELVRTLKIQSETIKFQGERIAELERIVFPH